MTHPSRIQPDSVTGPGAGGERVEGASRRDIVPARTPHEEAILAIWRDLLGRYDIGVLDDFFDLRANSLLALQVVARVRKTFGVTVAVKKFFESPTVAMLAAAVAAEQASAGGRVVGRRAVDAEPVLTFDQERLWLENQLRPGATYNIHGRQLLIGPLEVETVEVSFRAVLARHESLRTRFPVVAGRPVPIVDEPDGNWGLAVADVTTEVDRKGAASRLADEQAGAVFDLAQGPLFRCLLIRISETEHLLSVTLHHIVSDAWSVGLLVRELAALYRAGGDAETADLPSLPIQYRDYAVWQRGRLSGEVLDRELGYWRNHLAGAPPALVLPTTRRLTPSVGATADRVRCVLTVAETSAVHDLCRSRRATVFMALLAGLATVLSRWSGQRDLVIGVPIASRTAAGAEQLIGLFVNTLPFRIDLSGDPTFADLLERVRRVAEGGYAHADAPFDLLVKELATARDPLRTPLFQVILNAVDHPGVDRIGDLAVVPLELPVLPSPFDLTLTAQTSHAGALWIELDFNAERYQAELMEVLADHLHAVFRAAVADPTVSILDHPLQVPSPALAAGDPPVDPFGVGGADDRFAVVSRASDALLPSWGGAFRAGATLLDVSLAGQSASGPADIGALVSWLQANSISVLYLSAPILRAMAARTPQPQLPALKHVFVENSGELLAHDIDAARRLAPAGRCVAVYRGGRDGPPLATYPLPDGWSSQAAPLRVPLGRESGSVRGRLLHSSGVEAAIGEVAEIWFGTDRTGHLGRRRPDGNLEFVGVLGADPAIDPAETLAALRDMSGVRDAVVTAFAAMDGQATVHGYVVGPDPGQGSAEIRHHLGKRLPDRLIPEYLLVLEEIPLTGEGEYDWNSLPQFLVESTRTQEYVAARTPMERQLVEILEQLLPGQRIGILDNFFELGGFSLLGTQLAARVRETFDVDLPLRDVFETLTVDGLAQRLVLLQGELSGVADLEALLNEISDPGESPG